MGTTESSGETVETPTTARETDQHSNRTREPQSEEEEQKPSQSRTGQKMYPTPTQDSASERTKSTSKGKTIEVAVQEEVKMYPTPTRGCEEGENNHTWWREQSLEVLCRGGKEPGVTYGANCRTQCCI